MDFLLDNSLVLMDGPAFLALYISFILLATASTAVLRSQFDRSDSSTVPAIPPDPDPYEIAYLRGGANEAARSAIFSLRQRGLVLIVEDDKRTVLRPAGAVTRVPDLGAVEQTAIDWIGAERLVADVFEKRAGLVSQLGPQLAVYKDRLQQAFLLPSENERSRMRRYARITAGIVAAVGGYKIAASIAYGHFNVLFTAALVIVGSFLILHIGKVPRVTKLGKRYLERLQLAFSDLNRTGPAKPLAPAPNFPQRPATAAVDPMLLSVGLFGPIVLSDTLYADYNSAFHKARNDAGGGASGCGSACGSSCSGGSSGCGSSCGSGCGGGGCGGGCGG